MIRLNDILKISYFELKARNSRTKLNWLWNFIPQFFFVFCASVIFGNITGRLSPAELILISIGLVGWINFADLFTSINSCLLDHKVALQSNIYHPLWFPLRVIMRIFITSTPLILTFSLLMFHFTENSIQIAIILFFQFLFGLILLACFPLLLMYPTLFYRDLQPLNSMLLQLLFFVTPIGWIEINSKLINLLNKINPLAIFITSLRSTIRGEHDVAILEFSKLVLFALIAFSLFIFISKKYGKRIGTSL